MKKLIKKVVTILAVIILVEIICPMNNSKAAGVVYYTAIGDSITAQSNSYFYNVKSYLKQRYGYCEAINLGVGGASSGDFLDALTNPSNSYYTQFRLMIRLSNYITIDIGSNDYINGLVDIYAKHMGVSSDEMWNRFNELYTQTQSSNKVLAQKAVTEMLRISEAVHKDIYENNVLDVTYRQFKSNYIKLISEIRKIAPNAKIFVGNLYNPFVGAPNIYFGNIDTEKTTEKYITMSNKMISENSTGCKIVNLYSIFRGQRYLNADYSKGNMDPHPNAEGQKLIANQFIQAMK